MNNLDDKQLVIIATAILGGMAMFFMQDPDTVVSSVISGLFGIAVGRNLPQNAPPPPIPFQWEPPARDSPQGETRNYKIE